MRNKILYSLLAAISVMIIIGSCQSDHELNYARYYMNGKQVYEQHCKNCHGVNGEGLARLYPPLTDTAYLKTNKDRLACIIKNGISGPIMINGVEFNEQMPAESHLPDIDVAAVITYITNSFGNKQGLYDVANAGADLKGCRNLNEDKQ